MEFSAAQLQYLEHLNIDVWVPRDMPVAEVAPIPSAVESQPPVANEQPFSAAQVIEDQASTSPLSMEVAAQRSVAPPSSVEPQAPVQANQGLAAPAFPQVDPVVSPAAAEASLEKAPVFNIQFWCYSSGLWMVTDQVELLPEHHKFVHNVAAFLQGKKRKPRHVGIFSWPMLDSPNIDQGPAVATKYLNDHIQRLTTVVPVKKIVAFGECEKWFAGQPIVSSGLSLNSLFENPSLKKQLWQTLLPHQISE